MSLRRLNDWRRMNDRGRGRRRPISAIRHDDEHNDEKFDCSDSERRKGRRFDVIRGLVDLFQTRVREKTAVRRETSGHGRSSISDRRIQEEMAVLSAVPE